MKPEHLEEAQYELGRLLWDEVSTVEMQNSPQPVLPYPPPRRHQLKAHLQLELEEKQRRESANEAERDRTALAYLRYEAQQKAALIKSRLASVDRMQAAPIKKSWRSVAATGLHHFRLVPSMLVALLLAMGVYVVGRSVVAATSAQEWFLLKAGPKGGCYYTDDKGQRHYLDPEMCKASPKP